MLIFNDNMHDYRFLSRGYLVVIWRKCALNDRLPVYYLGVFMTKRQLY